MNFTMELRSRRSKSRTPVVQTLSEKSQDETLQNHTSVTKTVTQTFSTKTSYSDNYPSEIIEKIHTSDHITNRLQSVEKSEYKSSYQDDDEVTSTNMISQNTSNQTFEDSQNSLSSNGSLSALDFYRAAGDYWNKYPKTDYTYSLHSRDRKELAPGVIAMPNMSRRSLHNYTTVVKDYITSNNKNGSNQSFLHDEVDNCTKTNTWASSATKLQPRTLFSNHSTENLYNYSTVSATRRSLFTRITTFFKSILVTTLTFFYVIYTIQNSVFIWMGKKIHKAATHLMLLDTWLLQSRNINSKKLNSILALCLIPLLLFGGIHVLLASGVSLAPPCHPHCGRIASSYINSLTDAAYDSINYLKSKT